MIPRYAILCDRAPALEVYLLENQGGWEDVKMAPGRGMKKLEYGFNFTCKTGALGILLVDPLVVETTFHVRIPTGRPPGGQVGKWHVSPSWPAFVSALV